MDFVTLISLSCKTLYAVAYKRIKSKSVKMGRNFLHIGVELKKVLNVFRDREIIFALCREL